jgi:hypothetical protein
MSANPIDDNTTPKTTGSLEELFRHHLGEEAAVPPRPMLWDQIDNSLLTRQNEVYRKRLVATRWVAAASLLLASLAGAGWWVQRDGSFGRTEVAMATGPAAAGSRRNVRTATVAARNGAAENGGQRKAADQLPAAVAAGTARKTSGTYAAPETANNGRTGSSEKASVSSEYFAANSAPNGTGPGTSPAQNGVENIASAAGRAAGVRTALGATAMRARAAVVARTNSEASSHTTQTAVAADRNRSAASLGSAAETGMLATGAVPAAPTVASAASAASVGASAGLSTGLASASPAATSAALTEGTAAAGAQQVGLLAARPTALSLAGPESLPNGLATLSLPKPTPAATLGKWHYGFAYTVAAFNPNVNFSRKGIESDFDYNPALGPDSPELTEGAAAQYRENLRPGLSQRIALLATRHLKGHWSASTGLEFTQATAKSASTASFVGEQLYDLGLYTNGALRTTDFRYRMAGLPLEVSYSNPVKRGWSIYGRLGGVVSALLGVRSEVDGEPEATKTYSVATAGGPYRRVLGSLRGAMGAQFRPAAGNWALTLGPTAEMGLVPLNAHPAQSFLAQSRPYSFGMEAGVAFGR